MEGRACKCQSVGIIKNSQVYTEKFRKLKDLKSLKMEFHWSDMNFMKEIAHCINFPLTKSKLLILKNKTHYNSISYRYTLYARHTSNILIKTSKICCRAQSVLYRVHGTALQLWQALKRTLNTIITWRSYTRFSTLASWVNHSWSSDCF